VKDTRKQWDAACPLFATQEEWKQKEMILEDSALVIALLIVDMTKFYAKVKKIVTVAWPKKSADQKQRMSTASTVKMIQLLMTVPLNVTKPLEKFFAQPMIPQSVANQEHYVSQDHKMSTENTVQLTQLVPKNVHGMKYYALTVLTLEGARMQTFVYQEEKIEMVIFVLDHAQPFAPTPNSTAQAQSSWTAAEDQVCALKRPRM